MEDRYMFYKNKIANLIDNESLVLDGIEEDGVKPLAEALQGSPIQILYLRRSNLGRNGFKYLSQVLKDTRISTLHLENSTIIDDDVRYLAASLPDSRITKLNLRDNLVGCNGLKYLSQVLRETRITTLNLEYNIIRDEGVKCLAESLQDSLVTELDLRGNTIGTDAALYLNKVIRNTKISSLYLDVHRHISQKTCRDRITIALKNNKIGIDGAQYLNEAFQDKAIDELTLDTLALEADNAKWLAQAFKGIEITELKLCRNHIMQRNGTQYLVQSFKKSRIFKLNAIAEKIETIGAQHLTDFLREVGVLSLNVSFNYISDEGVKYLAPALKNSDIMYIDLSWNDIGTEGTRYLSEILQNSKIVYINLCSNKIGDKGATYLADGLPYSQVSGLHLYENMIGYEGYKYLVNVLDNTNISWVNLQCNHIEEVNISRNTTPIALELRDTFTELVFLNPMSNDFEFIIPSKDKYPPVDMDRYVFLIRTLNDNPVSKVHIFDMMCKNESYYDFNMMDKINEFITIMPQKFNSFFDSKLSELVETYDNYNFVDFVKQFEEMKQNDIVENLLLHRVLYYVDENQEILHPYIYKMLLKYNMPLYNEQLEPNKKEEIISYYQSHQEIDGVQEIIDLLLSESFKLN